MWGDVDGLDDMADGARLNQFPCFDGGLYLQPFRIHDGVDAAGGGDGLADFFQLLQCRDARLVREKIFARFHAADAQRCALVGDLGAQHQLDRRVVHDLILCGRDGHVGITLAKGCEQVGLLRPDLGERRPRVSRLRPCRKCARG